MQKILLIITLCLTIASCSTTLDRQMSSTDDKIELPGKLFKVSIPYSVSEDLHELSKELEDSHPEAFKNIIVESLPTFQRNALLIGFKFCTTQGYDNLGAVFPEGPIKIKLVGAHCISKDVSRKEIIRKSYGVGCRLLRRKSNSCWRAAMDSENYTVSTVDF